MSGALALGKHLSSAPGAPKVLANFMCHSYNQRSFRHVSGCQTCLTGEALRSGVLWGNLSVSFGLEIMPPSHHPTEGYNARVGAISA